MCRANTLRVKKSRDTRWQSVRKIATSVHTDFHRRGCRLFELTEIDLATRAWTTCIILHLPASHLNRSPNDLRLKKVSNHLFLMDELLLQVKFIRTCTILLTFNTRNHYRAGNRQLIFLWF
ncbi:uncharacterized protein LOC124413142 [Diprion similis]|uniref:uncharacterized protein LOC124413142 n=1 Tax=Diprion similis TaxID=362088 RepID=UPI001EF86CE4|nr:uncharacterized protein LOC124413142 [Diprion similis]